jgi:hypothetical protein
LCRDDQAEERFVHDAQAFATNSTWLKATSCWWKIFGEGEILIVLAFYPKNLHFASG